LPFLVISGSYHLVGQTKSGSPSGFEPDGDSVQFRPDQPALLDRLARVGSAYRLTSIGSTQLRVEGIDALELHFEGSHQPRPLADQSRDFLTGALGMNPVPYKPPDDLRVKPPVPKDDTRGFILARSLEAHGRPVAFAFLGDPPAAGGSEFVLKTPLLRKSLNYQSLRDGQSYPLFYDTLFARFRNVFAAAASQARIAKRGLWDSDRTAAGVTAGSGTDLEESGVVFPKLFRRLTTFLHQHPGDLAGFLPWLAKTHEQVLDLSSGNFTHFDNVIRVTQDKVRLIRLPEQLVFVSAKPRIMGAAPWLHL
jgi:endonuclease YncB( thermonuclease family)